MDAKPDKREHDGELSSPLRPRLSPARATPLSLTRFVNAAPATVYACWTEAHHIAHWFAPLGSQLSLCETDVSVNGRTQLVLCNAEGTQFSIVHQFQRVSPGKRLVFNEHCVGSSGVAQQAQITVTFEKLGNKTKLTLRAEAGQIASTAEADQERQDEWRKGSNEMLDRFEQYLSQPL
jgi:uncharacterized protein YndB with AHSA1/START domain